MRKTFSVMILAAIIFFCGQNNFANAQDVYAGNTGGLDFYVDTNTIVPTGDYEEMRGGGRLYYAFYVDVKKVEENSGTLKDINQWKFYITEGPGNGAQFHWAFDYYLSGTRIPVRTNQIAQNILRICIRYDSRIAS